MLSKISAMIRRLALYSRSAHFWNLFSSIFTPLLHLYMVGIKAKCDEWREEYYRIFKLIVNLKSASLIQKSTLIVFPCITSSSLTFTSFSISHTIVLSSTCPAFILYGVARTSKFVPPSIGPSVEYGTINS